ncbi:MAG: SPASM domain-containing protein [Oscillospiraceae bacterium]|nr:SPASM domain-containing protein [Oscillospiraceae bacterium]
MADRFKRAYVEITNICNLSCSFCHGTSRPGIFLSENRFSHICTALRPYTDYLYLHLMGEPTLHPKLNELISIAGEMGFRVVITTNGTLLRESGEILSSSPYLWKISISLQAFEGSGLNKLREYIDGVCSFAVRAANAGKIISLRLWNIGGEDKCNREITELLREYFPGQWQKTARNIKLSDNIYLDEANRFDWPDTGREDSPEKRVYCHGMNEQIGILSDGTVVPCCLDADGKAALGNIFEKSPEEILSSERAKALKYALKNGLPSPEELCRKCPYAERFSK